MSEFGFEVAQRGVDVSKAAEWQKVASSRWPYLKIKKQGYFSSPDTSTLFTTTRTVIYQHNLGYIPPFLIFVRTSTGWAVDKSKNVFSNSDSLYNTSILESAYDLFYIIFEYDIDSAPPKDPGKAGEEQGGSTNTIGIKAVKPSVNTTPSTIESKDYRDYSFHTGAKNMAVHLSGSQTLTNTGSSDPNDYIIRVQHNLGYLPTYLLYQWNDKDQVHPQPYIQTVDNLVHDDTKTLVIRGAQSVLLGKYYYLILKEPFATAL